MRGSWAGSLSVSLGLLVAGARAGEIQWRPAASPPAAVQFAPEPARPASPAVTLGRPVPMGAPAESAAPIADAALTRASYSPATIDPPREAQARSQSPEFSGPSLAPPPPPGVGGVPATPEERFNCGVVADPPPAGHGCFGKCKDWFHGLCRRGDGLTLSASGRESFQSDHCFDNFISPVTNPFLFEDPRALTELRPIFIHQEAPRSNWIYQGGDVEFFGVQARVAFTDRLSFVMNKLGWVWNEPHNHVLGFEPHTGFSEVWLGPKYTFLRNDTTNTLGAAGLTFQVPVGSSKVFQDTGSLSLVPYLSLAQNFGRSSYGSFNVMNTTGYSVATDSLRSDYVFSSLHLDYDVLNAKKFYPLVELNYRNYTSSGSARALGFEGGDLFNFGSTNVGGRNNLTIALGARYAFSPCVQTGLAVETPIIGTRDIMAYRVTFDMIFRY